MCHKLLPLMWGTKVTKMPSPVRQGLQDGGHQHTRDGLVEDGVTDSDDVHHRRGAEDGQHVGGHALPEVEQEALDLNGPYTHTAWDSAAPIMMRFTQRKCREEHSPRQSWLGWRCPVSSDSGSCTSWWRLKPVGDNITTGIVTVFGFCFSCSKSERKVQKKDKTRR